MRRTALVLSRALHAARSADAPAASTSWALPRLASRAASISPYSGAPPPSSDTPRRDLNRLLYRARQRGVLELDIIVGRWADEHVGGMDEEARGQLAEVLAVETPDLLAGLLGRGPPPTGLETNPAYAAMAASVEARLARASARTGAGKEWVNAWLDLKDKGNQ